MLRWFALTKAYLAIDICVFLLWVGVIQERLPAARLSQPYRVVHLPVAVLSAGLPTNTASLLISQGAIDELPQGPQSFDVLLDGSFVVADPLRHRVVIYGPEGHFRSAIPLGFQPDTLRVAPEANLIEIHDPRTQQAIIVDLHGSVKSVPSSFAPTQSPSASARLLDAHNGVVSFGVSPSNSTSSLRVHYSDKARMLVSLEVLPSDSGPLPMSGTRDAFIVLEVAKPASTLVVHKILRQYRGTRIDTEITDIPADYFIVPIDELRVRNGCLYQLFPARNDVRINVWKLAHASAE